MLSDLVEWYLSDRQVELKFVPTKAGGGGKIAPEFDFQYFLDGRRVTDRTLAMLIMTELARRNYAFNLARVIASLTEHSWRNYVDTFEYPDHLRNADAEYIPKRPEGRPRKYAQRIEFDELIAMPISKKPPTTKQLKREHLLAVIEQRRGEGVRWDDIGAELTAQGYRNVNGDRYTAKALQAVVFSTRGTMKVKKDET